MRFAHPEVFWLLLLLPVMALLVWSRRRAGLRRLEQALTPAMAHRLTAHLRPRRRGWPAALLLAAAFFLLLGAARPQRGTQYVTASRRGIDVLVALDVSESMLAEDLKPSRLVRARHEISAILDRLKGDRIGLIAFAGAAFVQCPLTLDYSAARMFLGYMTPELIPEPGTDLAEALTVAARAFESEEAGFRALILISDGEDHAGNLEEALDTVRQAHVRVFAVGIGSEGGEPIPERDALGAVTGYKKDGAGKVVLTRLNEAPLRRIAEETGGLYVRAAGGLGLDRVLAEIDAMEKREIEGGVRVLYEERYAYFVWPALVLLLAGYGIPTRRRAAQAGAGAVRLLFAIAAGGLLTAGAQMPPTGAIGAAAGPPRVAEAERPADEELARRIEENQVRRASDPDDPRPLYNLGTLHHLQDELEQANEALGVAGAWARGELAARVAYNQGNTLYRMGRLEEARDAFARAVGFDPENEDAKINLELTQRAIDTLQSAPDSSSCEQGEEPSEGQQKEQEQQKDQKDQAEQSEQQEKEQEQQQQQGEGQEGDQEQDPQESQTQEQQQQQDRQDEESSQEQSAPESQQQEQPSAQQQPEGEAADSLTAGEMQMLQILKGLEASEKELLSKRFQARSRALNVEKDW